MPLFLLDNCCLDQMNSYAVSGVLVKDEGFQGLSQPNQYRLLFKSAPAPGAGQAEALLLQAYKGFSQFRDFYNLAVFTAAFPALLGADLCSC